VVTYAFHCPDCGSVDMTFPMGEAPGRTECPRCGAWVRRRWTGPALARLRPAIRDAYAREERSRDEPDVVTRPGPGRHR
jgi:putative FmdB family regulatory protein